MTTSALFVTIKSQSMILQTLLAAILLTGIAIAQSQPPHAAKSQGVPATTSSAASTTGLPTEDTVNSFLFQMLGYDPTVTWKVSEIRPSAVPGLAEVTFIITNSQGANQNRLLVSADGRHAITGEILPFGSRPFD